MFPRSLADLFAMIFGFCLEGEASGLHFMSSLTSDATENDLTEHIRSLFFMALKARTRFWDGDRNVSGDDSLRCWVSYPGPIVVRF